jgi:hypothetical protein
VLNQELVDKMKIQLQNVFSTNGISPPIQEVLQALQVNQSAAPKL